MKHLLNTLRCMLFGHDYWWESFYDYGLAQKGGRYIVQCRCCGCSDSAMKGCWEPKIKPEHWIFYMQTIIEAHESEKAGMEAKMKEMEDNRKRLDTLPAVVKLASLVVHFDEMCYGLIPAEKEDFTLCRSMLNDPDIVAILSEFDRDCLLPIRRDQTRYKDRAPTRKA